jgi:hypothetical protein
MKHILLKVIKLSIWLAVFFYLGRLSVPEPPEAVTTEVFTLVPMVPVEQIQAEEVFTSEQDEIKAEIKLVFGEHYEDAMKLLTDATCHENLQLDPSAVHVNSDGTRDMGVFQINEHWQGFEHGGKAQQFLLDPNVNIRLAWRIYEDNGYTFSAWSCGQLLGI